MTPSLRLSTYWSPSDTTNPLFIELNIQELQCWNIVQLQYCLHQIWTHAAIDEWSQSEADAVDTISIKTKVGATLAMMNHQLKLTDTDTRKWLQLTTGLRQDLTDNALKSEKRTYSIVLYINMIRGFSIFKKITKIRVFLNNLNMIRKKRGFLKTENCVVMISSCLLLLLRYGLRSQVTVLTHWVLMSTNR